MGRPGGRGAQGEGGDVVAAVAEVGVGQGPAQVFEGQSGLGGGDLGKGGEAGVQGAVGVLDRTLRIMRTDPHRAWRAAEIAKQLGLSSHRGVSAELGRSVKEGMLLKPAP
ncbi:hypothetical protein [Kitasatospora sp. NPDC096204]|uniref:hypothetical protein n=1 Tax=Kitasatospora sp. NPDC096204 TaxID=3364094 RepID=UPI0037F34EB2